MDKIQQHTHNKINNQMSGTPIELKKGYSKVKLETTSDMITDETGLIHGGFIFCLADYSAMLAINHPNVVLGEANVKFMKPVIKGQTLIAEGSHEKTEGKKQIVNVNIKRDDELIFKGIFICFIPKTHVLKGS